MTNQTVRTLLAGAFIAALAVVAVFTSGVLPIALGGILLLAVTYVVYVVGYRIDYRLRHGTWSKNTRRGGAE